jgi:hypothetical protein
MKTIIAAAADEKGKVDLRRSEEDGHLGIRI